MKFHEFRTSNEKSMLILNGFGSCWARFLPLFETLSRVYCVVLTFMTLVGIAFKAGRQYLKECKKTRLDIDRKLTDAILNW